MIALIKALIPGALLSWVVSSLVAAGGSTGGVLNVHKVVTLSLHFSWSWPLFIAGTALAWALFWMTE